MAIIFIDNKPYEVKPGKNMLETCLTLGFDLPYFCWHPALGSVGACRQCAVKAYKDEDDKKGRLIMSCMEPITDKQRISIIDPEAVEFRANVIEWLMTNHPHDCAVCDEGGSCHLQDMTVMTGHNYRRFNFKKRTYKNQYLGPFINHEMNRCIQCYRCVRFYKDYAGGNDLDAFASKNNVYFGRHEDGVLENEFSGNLSEVCPTGVFTDKTLKEHYTRKWDLTMAPSVCHHCSLGCNVIGGERYGELRVIMNRYHGEVNGYFICDRGRFGYSFVNAANRIKQPIVNHATATRPMVLQEVAASIQANKKITGIGSPRASLQSNYALKALVGEDNFYHGVSDSEHDLAELAIRILREGTVQSATMREVEHADAVFVLGEDLTNTAPRLALAVRQASKNKFMPQVKNANIPPWHDAAVREIIQDKKGPVFIGTVNVTKLDDAAIETVLAAPDDLARIGFAVARVIDKTLPEVTGLSIDQSMLAQRIAEALMKAERPVVVSGASYGNASLMKAANNIATALRNKNEHARLALVLPESNSMGLAMMGGHRLNSAFDAVLNGHANTVIVMENDLYRHGRTDIVDAFLNQCKRVIVFDHIQHATAKKAHIVIPAGTFAESDGTMVNNEGRAQRFFQIYESTDVIQESWRWLLAIGAKVGNERMMRWQNFEDVTQAIADSELLLRGVDATAPNPGFRIAGQRIPRQPHRYSGRTAMHANINVSEQKPPVDPDSPLSYTMEGYHGKPPSSMIPFFWSPGWNSVQSVNKYQEEVGGPLRGGDPGVRLIDPSANRNGKYFTDVPEAFQPIAGHIWIVPMHHIYGSEELSSRSEPVVTRIPRHYILVSQKDALVFRLNEDQPVTIEIEGQRFALPVKISAVMPRGVAGVPYGFDGLHFTEIPAWASLKQLQEAEERTLSTSNAGR